MKIWLKIEALLNSILISLGNLIALIISKITPGPVKKSVQSTKNSSADFKKSTIKNFKEKFTKSKTWSKKKIADTKENVNKTKAVAQKKVIEAKSYDYKSLTPKKITVILSAFFIPLVVKIQKYLATLKPTTIVISTAGLMAFGLTSITIYKQTQEISEKTKDEVVVEPTKFSDTMDRNALANSRFKNYEAMTLTLNDVNIPIYMENRDGMQSLLIDFSFKASNRYIARYFEKAENEYLLRDRLYNNIQPIIPSFPMQPEGKLILKNKIILEINKLIKDLKIDGKVDEINIHSILNG